MARKVRQIHPNHPIVRNEQWARAVYDNSRCPEAWLFIAQQLRASADAIFAREDPIAEGFLNEQRRTRGNPEDFDVSKCRQPNFAAAFMLMAYALENLLKGLAVAKGGVDFSEQKLPDQLKDHRLDELHRLASPKATVAQHVLDTLTNHSEWAARYPVPTSVEKFWPMSSEGVVKSLGTSWPYFNKAVLGYYDALASELREFGSTPPTTT